MTVVYFVRHAQPDFSVHDDLTRPLTEKGRKDAQELVTIFKGKEVSAVLSSPYLRTMDTVKDIAKYFNYEIVKIDDFRERKIGDWLEDFNSYAEKQWADFDYKINSGESLSEVQLRNINALDKVLENYDGQNIIIGTHGTALSTIINYYDKSYGYKNFQAIKGIMPLIVKMTFDGKKYISTEYSHLKEGIY